jgi:methylmalonyl-CoA mutase N-terminal domain/subunit
MIYIYVTDGIEYVKAALAAGLEIDKVAPRLSFFFAIGNSRYYIRYVFIHLMMNQA